MVHRSARRSAAEWSQLVADFDKSGQGQQEFCQSRGVVWVTFRKWWRVVHGLSQRKPSRARSGASVPSRFVPVSISPPAPLPLPSRGRSGDVLSMYVGDVRIECPMSLGMDSIAQRVKSMRHAG